MTTQTDALPSSYFILANGQANAIANALRSPVVNSNQFVFFAAFDGTDNGANPPADGSGDSQTTAVRELFDQVLPNGIPVGNKGGDYEPGVGTPVTLPFSDSWDLTVTEQAAINAQNAYNKFAQ